MLLIVKILADRLTWFRKPETVEGANHINFIASTTALTNVAD